jgi:hypothetical protein
VKLSENDYLELFIWIPDQVGNDKSWIVDSSFAGIYYRYLSLSGLTRQSKRFRTASETALRENFIEDIRSGA